MAEHRESWGSLAVGQPHGNDQGGHAAEVLSTQVHFGNEGPFSKDLTHHKRGRLSKGDTVLILFHFPAAL